MTHAAKLGLFAGSIVVAVHACDYPQFEFRSGLAPDTTTSLQGGGGAAGAGATGGSGGTGHAGGGGNGGGGNAGGTDSGGQGGGVALPCDPLVLGACPGQKCTVVNESTGETGCATAGPLAASSVCVGDADCAVGLWCDHGAHVCKRVCDDVGDCADNATQCLPAQAGGGGSIPGLSVCVANCNPMSAGCAIHATCVYLGNPPLFDCVASLDYVDGDGCTLDSDCGTGLTCRGGKCRLWCNTPGQVDAWCKTFVWCCSTDPAPSYDGTALGYCSCP